MKCKLVSYTVIMNSSETLCFYLQESIISFPSTVAPFKKDGMMCLAV